MITIAEVLTLGLFLTGLTVCILTGTEILFALFFGALCFSSYALYRGVTPGNLVRMMAEGVCKVANILKIFILIGCLTALWRIGGTIPFILYHSVGLIRPQYFVLCTFLLCSIMSFLTGTSFGTVSTMGVICMMISNAAGMDPLLTAGAVLSGIFFGDRCSPMSSSAYLVCSLTDTDIYQNVRNMMRSAAIPFLVCCVLYVLLPYGRNSGEGGAMAATQAVSIFTESFSLHWFTVIPAVLIFVLAFLHVNVKIAMAVSSLAAIVAALVFQKIAPTELLAIMWRGCRFEEGSRLAELLDGGGILSNAKVMLIVMISSSYSGIFAHTPLIAGIRERIRNLVSIVKPFGTVLLTSILASLVSCNQSLATILTSQMCDGVYERKEETALALENTVILLAALVPWNIAGSVPVMTLSVDSHCLFFAFYLYLVPFWNLLISYFQPFFGRNSVRIS